MEAHNRKPLYYRSTNPNLPQVGEVTTTLFQWDETLQAPIEVQNSISKMPPEDIVGDYILWSDTYTLGYTNELEAAPIFFTNGGAGDDKIIDVINHVANRLGLGQTAFTDLESAKAWALTEVRIYVEDGSANAPVVCDPNVVMPVLGASGPGGLSSSLGFMPRATRYFSGGGTITSFDTLNLTKTYACTLEAFNDFDHISGTGWFGYADGLYTSNTGLTYGSGLPQVGDVIYRDPAGNNYFPENHGFVYQGFESADVAGGSSRIGLRWVSVGANGVVTSVDKMIDL